MPNGAKSSGSGSGRYTQGHGDPTTTNAVAEATISETAYRFRMERIKQDELAAENPFPGKCLNCAEQIPTTHVLCSKCQTLAENGKIDPEKLLFEKVLDSSSRPIVRVPSVAVFEKELARKNAQRIGKRHPLYPP